MLTMTRHRLSLMLKRAARAVRPPERVVWHDEPCTSAVEIWNSPPSKTWTEVGADGVLEHHVLHRVEPAP